MEFEWKTFPSTTLGILAEIRKVMTEIQCELETDYLHVKCTATLYGDRKETKYCMEDARRFAHGHWSFLGPEPEKTWYGTPYVQTEWKMRSSR